MLERQPYHIEVAANEIVQEVHVNTCITKIIRNVAAITFSKNCLVIKVQLSLVVSYSDANASSPGFTVKDSIFIGRQGWYLETCAGTSDHE